MYIYDHYTQNFTVQVTNILQQVQTDSDADSFDDESPLRGDTSEPKFTSQIFPAFWHTFLPPEHDHVNNPSVKH